MYLDVILITNSANLTLTVIGKYVLVIWILQSRHGK